MANTSPSETQPKVVRIQRFQIGLNVLVQLLVVAGIVAMLNYVSYRHFKRWDYSRDHKFTLVSQTNSLLGSLKKPVRAVVFFASAADIASDVAALLREYEFTSKGKFSVEIVDPYRNIARATELAGKYKIRENDNIVILDYDGRSKFVNAAEMADYEQLDQIAMLAGQTQPKLKAFKGEQAITSALLELTEGKPNRVYFVSGHGETDLKSEDLTAMNEILKRQNIELATLNLLNVNSVPEDTRSLAIYSPKYDYSELELKLIASFWEKKGRLLVFLNPYAHTPRLAEWLSNQGIRPQGDRILRQVGVMKVDPATNLPTGLVQKATPLAVFAIQDTRTSMTPPDLLGASYQLLAVTESLAIEETKETTSKTKFTTLLTAAPGSWGETDPVETEDNPASVDSVRDHTGTLNIAVAAEKGGVADARVKVDTSRMVVVGNGEFLGNKTYRNTSGVSLELTVNILNWLLDREELAGIPPREKKSIAIRLDETQMRNLAIAVMVAIPGFVALLGIANWSQRRT